ncbi:uncharacterized protein Z520_09521 [Fonsecaea multimorphosa CBS 102226]|uniref:Uncharacterized protein n=1 Tax=Fonsecaea multimorphosa CBS 102226 TaxID=1442371 RepID=A0A0D2ICF7_9EURO|nr:uncharacterized protein Z520_09521 [Fonsecaea multimorphosa CBS 102226]KIX94831.1 hypothetical protein Z520_09521 [Fonsecaea multimorphosa CBS 102226]OAL20409.1 hypothetical protein AYO22_08903 [Fonsecaea multimorphosa]
MPREIPRPRWIGGDSRNSAWFGLAKLLMHDEYLRIEAIRKSRRDRARAALLTKPDTEAVAAKTSEGDREGAETEPAREAVTDDDESHADEAEEGAEDVKDDTAAAPADGEKRTEGKGSQDREINGTHESKNSVSSPARSGIRSGRGSSARSRCGTARCNKRYQAQEKPSSRPRSGAASARTMSSQKTVSRASGEGDQQSQRPSSSRQMVAVSPPSSRQMSALSSARARHGKIIAEQRRIAEQRGIAEQRKSQEQRNIQNDRQGSSQFPSPRPSAVHSGRTGSDRPTSGHHNTTFIPQESAQRCSSSSSRFPSYKPTVAEWRESIGNPYKPEQSVYAPSFRSDFLAIRAISSPSTSSRLSQTTALTSISRRPPNPQSSSTPSCTHHNSPSVQPAERTLPQPGSPGALQSQTWNRHEIQTIIPNNQARHMYGQPPQQPIIPVSTRGQHRSSPPAPNIHPGTGTQIRYAPGPCPDGSVWNVHAQRSGSVQRHLCIAYPYPYQLPFLQACIPTYAGGYWALGLYRHHSPTATSYPYAQPPATAPPCWETALPQQAPTAYTY